MPEEIGNERRDADAEQHQKGSGSHVRPERGGAILFSQHGPLDESGTQREIAERHAYARKYECHACKTEIMGRKQVGEDDRRGG